MKLGPVVIADKTVVVMAGLVASFAIYCMGDKDTAGSVLTLTVVMLFLL